jgi:hypothetical protein
MFFFFRFVFVFSYILVLAINDKSHSPRVPRRPETAAVGFSVFFPAAEKPQPQSRGNISGP